jgi:hypothetical protein
MHLQPRLKKINWDRVLPYAKEFKHSLMCSALGVLGAADVIGRADEGLYKKEKAGLRAELKMSVSEYSMWLTIAKRDQRLREVIWELPPYFSTIYAIAALSDPEFDALRASAILHQNLPRADLTKWIADHRARASEGPKDDDHREQEARREDGGTAKPTEEPKAEEPEDSTDWEEYFPTSAAPESDSNSTGGLSPDFRKPRQWKDYASIWIPVDIDAEAVARLDERLVALEQEFPDDVRVIR